MHSPCSSTRHEQCSSATPPQQWKPLPTPIPSLCPLIVLVVQSVAGKLFFAFSFPLIPHLCSAQSRIPLLTALACVKYKKTIAWPRERQAIRGPIFLVLSSACTFSCFSSPPLG